MVVVVVANNNSMNLRKPLQVDRFWRRYWLKKRFVDEGFEAALSRKPVTNAHRRKITGDEEAHLIALYCSQVPDDHDRWTLRMLADKMVELDIIDAVSHETIRRTLKKMHLNLGKSKNGVFHQSKMQLLSATWRTS